MRRAESAEPCRLSMTADHDADAALTSPGVMPTSSGMIVVPVMGRREPRFPSSMVCPSRWLVGSSVGAVPSAFSRSVALRTGRSSAAEKAACRTPAAFRRARGLPGTRDRHTGIRTGDSADVIAMCNRQRKSAKCDGCTGRAPRNAGCCRSRAAVAPSSDLSSDYAPGQAFRCRSGRPVMFARIDDIFAHVHGDCVASEITKSYAPVNLMGAGTLPKT